MKADSCIMVAGARGLAGAAICRALASRGHTDLLTPSHRELELRDQAAVEDYFASRRPEYVFMAAAKVGGIVANDSYPADFIGDNLKIQTNVIDSAHRHGVKKLCFLGSSCIYPRLAPQPLHESSLLTGPLEPTNEWYAVAKIAGIKMCQAYSRQYGFNAISVMPTNLYGPHDNFDLQTSHVLPALLRKFHTAKIGGEPTVTVWGTGAPRREFLYVDDLADALCFLMERYDSPEIINVGVGEDLTIAELARLIADVVGYGGDVVFDRSKPDGTPRKLLDVSRCAALGWSARVPLRAGLQKTYEWYLANSAETKR
jgi:GDP-L-fucose synthase